MFFAKWFSLLCILIFLLFPFFPVSAQQSRPADKITTLGKDVYLFRHQSHQAIFIITPEGAIVTDPISLDAATWLKAEIKKLTDQPVRYVIYSHHHNDHISGGSVFVGTAHFVSHQAARPKLLQAADPSIPVPDLTFNDRMAIDLGANTPSSFIPARTSDNSLVVLLPQNKRLFAVDFIPVETVAYRALPDAYPDAWIESLKQVERLDFDILVPGHGKVGKKEHVRLFREYLEALRSAVSEQVQKGAAWMRPRKPSDFHSTNSGRVMQTGSQRT